MESKEINYENQISNREIIHQIIGLSLRHRKIMQSCLDKTGVYQAQHYLLMKISHNPNVSQKDIAVSMDVSPATIAVSLKKLERGGYIRREVDKGDNRLNQITITDKGNKVVEQSKQIFESRDRKVLEGFSDEEKHTLSALLKKLDTNLIRMEDEVKSQK